MLCVTAQRNASHGLSRKEINEEGMGAPKSRSSKSISGLRLVSMWRVLAAVLSPTIWRQICPPVVSSVSVSTDVVLQAVAVVVVASGQDVFVWCNYPRLGCMYSELSTRRDIAYRKGEGTECVS